MKCLHPFFVKEKKILVPCGKCLGCKITRRQIWTGRMLMELTSHPSAIFVTLTYSENPIHLSKRDLQLFFKRLRKQLGEKKIRYFACGEYGEGKGRPHYHAIIYGMDFRNEDHKKIIESCWQFGFVHFGDASKNSMQYVAGYVTKKTKFANVDDRPPEFVLMSRRPALGSGFLEHLKNNAFIQHPFDVISVIRVGAKNYPLDRTIRGKLRDLVMQESEVKHVKNLKLLMMKDELIELIAKHFGTAGIKKFIDSKNPEYEAYNAYYLENFEVLQEKYKFLERREFRKDL